MPKYRFECENCSRTWWEWMSITDPLPEICPHCNNGKPLKLMSKFVTIKKKEEEKKSAKDNVIDHIEENREILKQMKKEAKKKDS